MREQRAGEKEEVNTNVHIGTQSQTGWQHNGIPPLKWKEMTEDVPIRYSGMKTNRKLTKEASSKLPNWREHPELNTSTVWT